MANLLEQSFANGVPINQAYSHPTGKSKKEGNGLVDRKNNESVLKKHGTKRE
jgi:hypothetical protein